MTAGLPREREPRRLSIPWIDWRRMFLNDPCVYCGLSASVLDHIIPRSRGGVDGWMNRAPACANCDKRKASAGPVIYLFAVQRASFTTARRHYRTPNHRLAAEHMIVRRFCSPKSTAERAR